MRSIPDRSFNSPLARERLEHTISLTGLNAGSHILDVGCGNGARLEIALETSGARAGVGVDPNQSEIDNAHKLLAQFGKNAVLHNAEWDHFENTILRVAQTRLAEHPGDTKARSEAARWKDWNASYQRWGRGTFGFGLFLLRTPRKSYPQRSDGEDRLGR